MGKVVDMRAARPSGWNKDRWEVAGAIAADSGLTPLSRLVGVVLIMKFANHESGKCTPGLKAIMRSVGSPRSSTMRALAQLQAAGWLRKTGGNAPGRNAGYAFGWPEQVQRARPEQVQQVRPEQVPQMGGTGPTDGLPPRPPYMEEPNLNHKEPLHPKVAIRGLPMPDFRTKLIAPGSVEAQRWDEWLAAKGYPTLARIGRRDLDTGHYQMPVSAAPAEDDQHAYRIALRWAEWLRSRA